MEISAQYAKYFLQIHLFGEMIVELSIYYVDIRNTVVYNNARVQYSKTCITHKTKPHNRAETHELASKLIFVYNY